MSQPLYAQPGTTIVEGSRDFGFGFPTYRVRWKDPNGYRRQTRMDMLWGEAHLLADMLEHGEPYIRSEWVN
jgi:hypothetical protein